MRVDWNKAAQEKNSCSQRVLNKDNLWFCMFTLILTDCFVFTAWSPSTTHKYHGWPISTMSRAPSCKTRATLRTRYVDTHTRPTPLRKGLLRPSRTPRSAADTNSPGYRLQPALAYPPRRRPSGTTVSSTAGHSDLCLAAHPGREQKGASHVICFPLYLKTNELKNSRFLEGHKAPLQFTAHIAENSISEHILDCSPPEVNQELTAILTNNYKILAKLYIAWEKCT